MPLSYPTKASRPPQSNEHRATTGGHLQRTVHIDWNYLLKQRPVVLAHSALPPYLLLPEVHALLDYALHSNHRLMINTLWHTGARISECLDLTHNAFHLDSNDSYVSIGDPLPRLVPVTDTAYLLELEHYFTTHRLRAGEKLFRIGRHGASKRIRVLADKVRETDGVLPVNVTPHTFRHSFAVNAVLHGVPLPVIKQWLGHRNIQSTEIYTQVLATEARLLMQWIAF